MSEDQSLREQDNAPAQRPLPGDPVHDGLLIVDGSGKIEPLGQSSSRAWQVPQGGRTMPLNQRFAHRWRIPQQMLSRLSKDNDLRHALDKDHLTVYYQPEADVQTDCVVGMEALVRWQHPRRGLVLPDEFIPLAERTGFIVRLGEWVLRRACSVTSEREDAGLPSLRVAVNLSPRQFQQPNLIEMIAAVLEDSHLDPRLLELEITESSAMEHATYAIYVLQGLAEMGVRIVLDDFGTGFSSLGYLKDFPIHALKIDRSFVKDMESQPKNAAIVSAIIGIAHSLSLEVIAEGVEVPAQLAFLREKGCDRYQGFLLAKPMPPSELALQYAA